MDNEASNLSVVAGKIAELNEHEPDKNLLCFMTEHCELVHRQEPTGLVGGIDSSDNLLLNIPEHPGAAIAGYSFSLTIAEPDGTPRFVRERMAERHSHDYTEPLEIALIYSSPLPNQRRVLHIADYQLRVLLNTPSSRSPYDFEETPPEFKVRLVAARHRETTERRAVRTSLYQSEVEFGLLLKDGRHSSQNVSTRYTDDVGRRAVERGVRYVGVVKQGTLLTPLLYPYHKALYQKQNAPYWTLIAPELILQAYTSTQAESKTIRLGAQENQSLGGIGGAWILYGNSPSNFYVLEFNVYDMVEFRHLVNTGIPLEVYVRERFGWHRTHVAQEHRGSIIGTQTLIQPQDIEELIAVTVGEIHYLAQASVVAAGYPIVLADAHNRCKITTDRKSQLNQRLIVELHRRGYHAVDFETWSEDPHKIFEW